jgi:lipopolysaccharide transport protein LptA
MAMANLRAETALLLLAALLPASGAVAAADAATASGAAATRAVRSASPEPELDFDTLEYQRGKVVLSKVTIQQGAMRVQADLAEAAGLDFDNNTWIFTGDVKVQLPEGSMEATRAIVQFRAGRIATATVTGLPATFAQRSGAGSGSARGRAAQIDYDASSGDVRLRGEAFLSDERSEISSGTIVYSIPQRTFRAEGGASGERVRGTIRPTQKKPVAEGAAP